MFKHSRKDHVEDPFGFCKKAIQQIQRPRLDGCLKRFLGLAEVGLAALADVE